MGNPFIEAYKKNGVVGAINKLEEMRKTDLNCDHLTEDNITELIDTLIENGEDLNTVNENGVSLLHIWHSPEFIKKAVNAGGNINLKDKEGNTPLKNFATNASDWTEHWEESDEIFHTLEALRDYFGMPLPHVDTQEFHDILKTYLELGADPDSS